MKLIRLYLNSDKHQIFTTVPDAHTVYPVLYIWRHGPAFQV